MRVATLWSAAALWAALTVALFQEDHGDQIEVTIREVTAGRPVIGKNLFAPSPNATFCHIYSKLKPDIADCLHVHSDRYKYINTEYLEPVLKDQRVHCDERASAYNNTDLSLSFINSEAFEGARLQWSDDEQYIFMTEDPHCFEGKGDRSFYLSNRILWNQNTLAARVRAAPLPAYLGSKSGWADTVKQNRVTLPPDLFAHPRPSEDRNDTIYIARDQLTAFDEESIVALEKRDGEALKLHRQPASLEHFVEGHWFAFLVFHIMRSSLRS